MIQPQRHQRSNPHAVLGVSATSTYDEVRRAFVKLALEHHPDLSPDDGEGAKKFISIRKAFETIRNEMLGIDSDNPDSSGTAGEEDATSPFAGWSPEELREWYRQETGEWLSFDICDKTRNEIIHVYNTMSAGGKDKGGYWEMARQLAEREASRPKGGHSVKQLMTGSAPKNADSDSSASGLTRRRQRRR